MLSGDQLVLCLGDVAGSIPPREGLQDGTIRHTLNSRLKNIEALTWTPAARILASAGSNQVWKLDEDDNARVVSNSEPVSLWDADSGKLLDQITPPKVPFVRCKPNSVA